MRSASVSCSMGVALFLGASALGQCVSPSVVTQPESEEWCLLRPPGEFSLTATGTQPLVYQWRRDGIDIPGANEPTYTDLRPGQRSTFTCVVANACGSVTSEAAGYSLLCVIDIWGCDDLFPVCGCRVRSNGQDDLLTYLYCFAEGLADADCDDGTFTGTLDGGITTDDLLYWLYRFVDTGC